MITLSPKLVLISSALFQTFDGDRLRISLTIRNNHESTDFSRDNQHSDDNAETIGVLTVLGWFRKLLQNRTMLTLGRTSGSTALRDVAKTSK